jgi:hypothetical protein
MQSNGFHCDPSSIGIFFMRIVVQNGFGAIRRPALGASAPPFVSLTISQYQYHARKQAVAPARNRLLTRVVLIAPKQLRVR